MNGFVLKTTGHLGMKVVKYSQPKYFNFSIVVSQDSQVLFSQTDLLNELEQKRDLAFNKTSRFSSLLLFNLF